MYIRKLHILTLCSLGLLTACTNASSGKSPGEPWSTPAGYESESLDETSESYFSTKESFDYSNSISQSQEDNNFSTITIASESNAEQDGSSVFSTPSEEEGSSVPTEEQEVPEGEEYMEVPESHETQTKPEPSSTPSGPDTGHLQTEAAETEADQPSSTQESTPETKPQPSTPSQGITQPPQESPGGTDNPAESVNPPGQDQTTPPPETMVQPPVHTHSWTESGRVERTDCFQGVTTLTITYSCGCGETKQENSTSQAVCNWQWVGEWQYSATEPYCHKWRTTYHTCVNHGTTTEEAPGREDVVEHHPVEQRTEPSCTTQGYVKVYCDKCNTVFPDQCAVIVNAAYPDGGGTGHHFAEVSRRNLSEEEAAWYGEGKAEVTYECSGCGERYTDIVDV